MNLAAIAETRTAHHAVAGAGNLSPLHLAVHAPLELAAQTIGIAGFLVPDGATVGH